MAKKSLKTYTPEEISKLKELSIKASSYGLTTSQCASLVGITAHQLDKLFREDDQFDLEFKQARQSGIHAASAQMHELARKGNYQAAAFILQKSPDSPYSEEGMMDPKKAEAMQRLLVYMSNYGGLLPPPLACCPSCGHRFTYDPMDKIPPTSNITIGPDGLVQ